MVKMLILRAVLLLTSCMGSAPGTAPEALSRSAEANRLQQTGFLGAMTLISLLSATGTATAK